LFLLYPESFLFILLILSKSILSTSLLKANYKVRQS
jgi:hypothetical protein